MFNKLGAAWLTVLLLLIAPSVAAQSPTPTGQPHAPGLRKLTGDDEKRAKQLNEQIDKSLKADRWDEAVAKAEILLALRARAQGHKHFETVDAEWRLKALRRVASTPKDDRDAFRSALEVSEREEGLNTGGNFTRSQPLFEKALEVRRRLLTDSHPATANSYNFLANNLQAQGKYAQAQPILEKALEIYRRLGALERSDSAAVYNNLALNLYDQGKYEAAQPLYAKALEIRRGLLTDDHQLTAQVYQNLASNLYAQGKYLEAKDQLMRAVRSLDSARLRFAFSGLDRATGAKEFARVLLAAALARLGQPAPAWQVLEEDLGRGLLDELAARENVRLTSAERAHLRELTAKLEQLDRLIESTPKQLDKAERANRFEDLRRQRALASIALGEFQTKLVQKYGALAGQVATLKEIQAALPADSALVTWVDAGPAGPHPVDPDGEHWGVVVRSQGAPDWVPIEGTGPNGVWTDDDTGLASRVRTALRDRPGAGSADLPPLMQKLQAQRLEPLTKSLGAKRDGLPPARRLIVLPSRAMAGIPIETVLAPADNRTVAYAPSGTVFKYLREQPRPEPRAGLLALGDPVFDRLDKLSDPKPVPDHGLLLNVVARGSNAANHGLKAGDVLLAYNGQTLNKRDDLKVIAVGDKPVAVDFWRDGQLCLGELAPGKLGVMIEPRPAPVAIAEQRDEPQAGLRRPPLRPRDSAELGHEGRARDTVGLSNRAGPRSRRRGLCRVHPGALDVWGA